MTEIFSNGLRGLLFLLLGSRNSRSEVLDLGIFLVLDLVVV